MSTTMICRDIYVRHTAGDGASFVQQHRFWCADLFMAARQAEASQAAAQARSQKEPAGHKVEQVTREIYLQGRTR